MNSKNYVIRPEEKEDYREVENLVRESFWNVYRPGCSEHYVIHVLRDDSAFVKRQLLNWIEALLAAFVYRRKSLSQYSALVWYLRLLPEKRQFLKAAVPSLP